MITMRSATPQRTTGLKLPTWLKLDLMLIIAIAILVVIGVITIGGQFLEPPNLRVILMSCGVSGLLAISQTLVLIVREIDLALGATLVFAPLMAVFSADKIEFAINHRGLLVGLTGNLTGGWWLIVFLTLVYATVIGIVMSFITAYLKIPSFVVTIGLSFVMIGTGYVLSRGTPIFFQNVDGSEFIGNTFIGNLVPWSFVCFLIVAVMIWFIMNWTKIRFRLYATGGNARSATLTGINTRRWCVIAYAMAGAVIGVAAILNMSRMQGIDIGQSANFALQSIVISILGGVRVQGGEGRIFGVVLATIVFTLLMQMLSSLGLNFYGQMVASGLVVLIFTALSKRADSNRLHRMRKIEV